MPPAQRVKLIYNPAAGRSEALPNLLQEVIGGLQALNFIPEVYLLGQDSDPAAVIREALRRKTRLFVVCGGDGTIETIARLLIGKRATLGILPAGTQNNIALSLGIPNDVKKALELLRSGSRSKMDVGLARSAQTEIPFLEICSVGLFSALFESADHLQKGNLASLGDIFSTLASFPLAKIDMRLDDDRQVSLQGHVALVANLPFFGLNYRVSPDTPFDDGLLDVLVFSEFSKLELVGNVLQNAGEQTGDARLRRYRARKLEIRTEPAMPVQADGASLGNTPVKITVKRRALTVISGLPGQRPAGGQPWGFLRNLNLLRFFK